jgi:hypothetical protein
MGIIENHFIHKRPAAVNHTPEKRVALTIRIHRERGTGLSFPVQRGDKCFQIKNKEVC